MGTAGMMLYQYIPYINDTTSPSFFSLNINSLAITILTCIFMYIEKTAGALTGLYLLGLYHLQQTIYKSAVANGYTTSLFWMSVALLYLSLGMQVVGHSVFEKRRPAASVNGLLGLVAPFFVTVEILVLLGWKREFMQEMDKEIKERIRRFREEEANAAKNK